MNLPIEAPYQPMISPYHPPEESSASTVHDPFLDLLQPTLDTPGPIAASPFGDLMHARDFLRAYGLRENPFSDSIHPQFFYRTDGHADAFRSMMLAVDFDASLGLVTGPSGTGKTLVTQMLLQHLQPPRYHAIIVSVTPGLSKTGLLREILSELNVALPVGSSRVQDLTRILANHIIDLHERGQRLVILIDECHLLSADCLHIVRTISNIETPQCKLTTCLLFAEGRLLQRLTNPSYESLRNRIYLRSELAPLSAEDAAQYIKYRVLTAGRLGDLFTDDALDALHRRSGGICRTLNKLAMLSLIEGARLEQTIIDESVVSQCAARL